MKPRRPKGYDNSLEDMLTIDYVRTALRETLFAQRACPHCGAAAYLTPWHDGHFDWWCLACNWQGNIAAPAKGHPHE